MTDAQITCIVQSGGTAGLHPVQVTISGSGLAATDSPVEFKSRLLQLASVSPSSVATSGKPPCALITPVFSSALSISHAFFYSSTIIAACCCCCLSFIDAAGGSLPMVTVFPLSPGTSGTLLTITGAGFGSNGCSENSVTIGTEPLLGPGVQPVPPGVPLCQQQGCCCCCCCCRRDAGDPRGHGGSSPGRAAAQEAAPPDDRVCSA